MIKSSFFSYALSGEMWRGTILMMKENLQTALGRMTELIQPQSIGDVERAAQLQMPYVHSMVRLSPKGKHRFPSVNRS